MRTPGPTGISVVVLAVGIAATTSLAAVAHALLLEPLPFAVSGRPVQVIATTPQEPAMAFAPANYLDLVERSRSFAYLAAYRVNAYDLTEPDSDPERVTGAEVTSAFFAVFDTTPVAGRLFQPTTDLRASESRVVLSEQLWRRRFQGGEDVIGRRIEVNGVETVVVGVAAASFDWPASAQLWMLADDDIPSSSLAIPDLRSQREFHYLGVVGRLTPDTTLESAGADVSAIAAELGRTFPRTNGSRDFRVVTLEEQTIGDARAPVLLLAGAASLVLLVAWANVAGLQLARGAARVTEMAVRGALGAGRWRLARGLLAESLLVGAAGGASGIVMSFALVRVIRAYGSDLPRVAEIAVDPSVLAAAAAATLLCSLLFGTAQALQGVGAMARGLRAGRGTRASHPRGRAALVVAEVGLALVLVSAATLFARSAAALVNQDPGFDDEAVWQVGLTLPSARYPARESQAAFYRDVLERARTQPALGRTAIAYPLPTAGGGVSGQYAIYGQTSPEDPDRPVALFASVSDGFFAAAGIPLRRGRDFTSADTASAEPVVIVNETLVRLHWPDSDPLAGRVNLGGDTWFRVVGVAADVRQESLHAEPVPLVYIPYDQFTVPFSALVFRPADRGTDLAPLVRDLVREIDPRLPVSAPAPFSAMVWNQTEATRMRSIVLAAFATVALLLAAVGLYGLMSFIVLDRTREFGVRMALGAKPGDLVRLVGRQGLGLAAIGIAAGLVAAWWSSRLVASLLFAVTPTDWVSYGAAVCALGIAAAAATFLPARRAASVDPVVSMRVE